MYNISYNNKGGNVELNIYLLYFIIGGNKFMKKDALYNILIVDDNKNNLISLRALIEEYINANVIEADCGEQALKRLLKQPIDLIILDVQMEGMNGFELTTLIKQRKKTQNIPIVFLTAMYTNEEFKKRGFEVGAVDYLTKPIDEYQLINRINVYLKMIEKERSMNIILEQKVNEQVKELKEAKEIAERLNESKSTFIANVSHELRTPLNILLSTTQLIKLYLKKDEALDRQKIQNKINIQVQNCYRLLRLINNLIDITKIDAGYFNIRLTSCNIIEIVEEITMSVVEYVENKGIHLIFDTDIEEKVMQCDLDAIERIILNLLSNAIKYTPEDGSIFVDVKDLGDNIQISIKDTGIGIPEDKLNEIFERFRQVDNFLTRQSEGSGIGLSLVKSLVEMHNGEIFVESEYEKGSKFIVKLPTNLEGDKDRGESKCLMTGENIMNKIHIEFSDIYF